MRQISQGLHQRLVFRLIGREAEGKGVRGVAHSRVRNAENIGQLVLAHSVPVLAVQEPRNGESHDTNGNQPVADHLRPVIGHVLQAVLDLGRKRVAFQFFTANPVHSNSWQGSSILTQG
ncbi:MAG: hypothetical protein ABSB67_03575 [Bryobacteraceae bacterium]